MNLERVTEICHAQFINGQSNILQNTKMLNKRKSGNPLSKDRRRYFGFFYWDL